MQLIVGSLFTLLLGWLLTLTVRALAHRIGVVAAPRQDRWHQKPTAMLGGIAIYGAFIVGYLTFAPKLEAAVPILIVGTLLLIAGLVDDLIQIKPYAKLIIQLIAAAVTVSLGLHMQGIYTEAINTSITIFWLVGITNAVNLLDNMDGLAGGVSLIGCLFLGITFLLNGQPAEAALPTLLGGAVLSFLFFNFHRASIFMGDCGSMFLGFMLGAMTLLNGHSQSGNLISILLTPVLIMMIPIFDTCVVTATRKLSGRPISRGGRDHTSHRLVALGMSERQAVMLLYAFAIISGALALMVRLLNTHVLLLLVPSFALASLFVGLYLGKVRVYEQGQPPPGNTIINVLAKFSYKRRLLEIVLDAVLVVLADYAAYLLRFDGNPPSDQLVIFGRTLPLMIAIQMLFFLLGGIYGGLWRYVGVNDLIVIARSVLAGTVVSWGITHVVHGFHGPLGAVFVLDALLLLVFVSASRVSFRLLRALVVSLAKARPDAMPVLIYGAGDHGELLIREILNNPDYHYVPVGFVDDDGRKAGYLIHGYRIFHSRELPGLIRTHHIGEVLISTDEVP